MQKSPIEQSKSYIKVWGTNFEFVDFADNQLGEIFETFAGSVQRVEGNGPKEPALIIRFVQKTLANLPDEPSIPRHRGGSSAKKFFCDGSPFRSTIQNRDIVPVFLDQHMSCYASENMLLIATSSMITLLGENLPTLLLSDIVENYLLWKARKKEELMVHCSGWIHDDAVELVVGSSGIGKTTELFRHLISGAQFFSNDRAFLRLTNGILEVRSFPLPVNVGCGTIRSLNLAIPHFDFPDSYKIRFTPDQVLARYGGDYEKWFPVRSIFCSGEDDLQQNLYWEEDACHPFWNEVFQPAPFSAQGKRLYSSIVDHLHVSNPTDHGRITLESLKQ